MTTTETPSIHNLSLPPRFYWDHRDRDLPSGTVLRETKRDVRVAADLETWNEILSDARHYVDPANGYSEEYPGLVSSARSTVKRIERFLEGLDAPRGHSSMFTI